MKKTLSIFAASAIALAVSAQSNAADDRYIIKFKEGKGAAVKAQMRQNGGRSALALDKHNAFAAHLPEKALRALEHNPHVEYVEEDVKRYPLSQTTP